MTAETTGAGVAEPVTKAGEDFAFLRWLVDPREPPGLRQVTPARYPDALDEGRHLNGTQKVALITGVAGQDGSYLADLLIAKGYRVIGLMRRSTVPRRDNLRQLETKRTFSLVQADMTDASALRNIVQETQPDEVYNLAAQSFVHVSWENAAYTNETNFMGFLHLLEAVRSEAPSARVYQASSSEMYGNQEPPLNEDSPMIPRSPYGVSKLAAHRLARVYRESHGLFVACGICFNHESPRRGPEFVTRKIAMGIAKIKAGNQSVIYLGDVTARRDWGHARDFVRGMWLTLQAQEPDDFVFATGMSHAVKEFLNRAVWEAGLGGRPEDYYRTDPGMKRPAEIHVLVGDSSKAMDVLGWRPEIDFIGLVREMVQAELEAVE